MKAEEINKNSNLKLKEESRNLRRKPVAPIVSDENQAIEKQAEQLVSDVIEQVTSKTAIKKKPAAIKVSFENVHPTPFANLIGRGLLLAKVKFE